MNFDLTTLAGMSAAVLAAVSGLKTAFPEWVAGKESKLSLILGFVAGIVSHLVAPDVYSKGAAGWAAAVIAGISAGIASQVLHDKALNPMIRRDEKK